MLGRGDGESRGSLGHLMLRAHLLLLGRAVLLGRCEAGDIEEAVAGCNRGWLQRRGSRVLRWPRHSRLGSTLTRCFQLVAEKTDLLIIPECRRLVKIDSSS